MNKWKSVLILVLVLAAAGNVYFWNYRYLTDTQKRYDLGFYDGREVGYVEGNQSGYQLGYENGYNDGNSSGYQIGYSDGNYSGYYLGYDDGEERGYDSGFYYGNVSGFQKGFSDGNETGFADGYIEGVEDGAGRGYTIRDPTYREALDFIALDRTDENEYSGDYTCLHFTADVKNNAFQAGYRCGFVYVEFPDSAHAVVCFDTTGNGLIFIEPQTDEVVALSIGQAYDGDIVVGFTIVW